MVSLKVAVLALCYLALSSAKSINLEKAEDGYLFEGDMVMSKQDIEQSLAGGPSKESENLFGLSKSQYKRWPNGVVPYTLDSSISNTLWRKSSVRKAMKQWEEKTCVRFVERTDQKDYVEFFADFGKCYSYVGRTGGKQRISLGFGCFGVGTAIHEIGHMLGMWHEQSRPDRDDYVEIVWDNITEDQKHNFRKYSTYTIDSRGSPYDYDSIMHYEWNAFSKFPGLRTTIRSKNGAKFGQRSHISVQDAIQINRYYECDKKQ
ncbi:zinc metalloproteinase nas-4-like [Clytia hemisphaerica]|uniref:Metalloendopeptidase n=1 Tax=Clytia hemisphaerica TaxID=252671 RepID=A0A7M5WXA0_9CNID